MARAEFLPFVEYFQIVGQHLRLREEGQPAEVQPPETGQTKIQPLRTGQQRNFNNTDCSNRSTAEFQKYSLNEQLHSGISKVQSLRTVQQRNFKTTATWNRLTTEFQNYSHLEQVNSEISKIQPLRTVPQRN